MKTFALAFAGVCLWLGTLAAAPQSFTYDAFAPLEYEVDTSATDGGVEISQVSFRSGSTLLHAALVSPDKPAGSMPAVLFVHWLGAPESSNAAEFLPDAQWLARRGVVSLLPDEPWSRPDWFDKIRSTATDATDSVATVIALRRCLDVLEKTPGVDPKRLAFVGHDFGASYGALLAGADSRPSLFVFMTPTSSLAGWFLRDAAAAPADHTAYLAQMSAFDIPASLERSTFTGSLTQFATHDEYVSASDADTFARALPVTDRTVRKYDTTHALAIDAATDDRRTWLGKRFGLAAL